MLEVLVGLFESSSGIRVKVIAIGSGQALELGRRGDADVLLVHSPDAEARFVADGEGIERTPVFYSDFVLVGSPADPARAAGTRTITAALQSIVRARQVYVSRGDDSGTHKKEQSLWNQAGVTPSGAHYLSTGSGMAETLRMVSERDGYALADRGTVRALAPALKCRILFQGGDGLRNPFSVLVVNPTRHPDVNTVAARRLAAFLLLPTTRRTIREFGTKQYGDPLFRLWSLPAKAGHYQPHHAEKGQFGT